MASSLTCHSSKLTSLNARELLAGQDAVVDATDNYEARYAISDACASTGAPHVYGAVFGFEGRVSVFDAKHGPCYRCLHPTPPPAGQIPDCAEGGVLGPVPGVVGSIQAIETVKLIAGCGRSLLGKLLMIDTLAVRYRLLDIRKDPACPTCSTAV